MTLVNPQTSAQQKTTSNTDGRYVFANVDPGTYNVIFTKSGFASFRVAQQAVEVGSTLTINATLALGSTSTTVEVTAESGAQLQTTSAAVGTTLNSAAILALPNLGRDVTTLSVLQPGVTMGGYTAGAVQDQNTYTIDGGNNSDDMAGNNTSYVTNFTGLGGTQTGGNSSGVVPTSVETIEEVKVNTFNQTADFNTSMGSQVQMVTKRGQNQVHGALYEYYFGTDVGAANSWSNDHTPSGGLPYTKITPNHRNRFGASVGGPFAPNFLGGKWYFFFNYEGFRFPNVGTYEHPVPSALLRNGIVQLPNANGTYVPYNLNPTATTVGGVTYQPAQCGAAGTPVACDPRGIGISPVIQQIWNKYMPMPNDPLYGSNGADGENIEGYISSIRAPLNSDAYTGRIDHDFNDKWHFMGSYRSMRLVSDTTNQVDIGGALRGDTLGSPVATAPRDQIPSLYVAGLTTIISPTTTNNFTYSYLRNFWQWGSANAPPQLPGLAGAVEIGSGAFNSGTAESATAAGTLIPYNVNTQSIRQRFWDGQDNMFKDDLTTIHGNHVFQYGGLYQRNYDFHMRTDNGVGVNNQVVYQVDSSGVNFPASAYPVGLPASQQSTYADLASEVLGIVSQPQVAYTRSGASLNIEPIGSQAYERSVIPTYNLYWSDTWHMKPSLTLTYGLSYALELPPYEIDRNQVVLVNSSGNEINAASFYAQRQTAALQGQVYDPTIAYATIANVAGHPKYPYNPVWDELSPRVALAWSPKYSGGLMGALFGDNKTVLRGGYGRIFGRLNGVNLVLVPLLGPGLIQAVSCQGASISGTCAGTNNVTPATAFRIGPDGLAAPLPQPSATLSQPYFPGLNGNPVAQDPSSLDPNYKPERTDNFTFSIQRELTNKMTFELGYIGRIIKNEEMEVNLDAVPTMTTLNGQSFAQAYAATYLALCGAAYCSTTPSAATAAARVQPQPFLEAALGGAGSAYCTGYASCTAAVAAKNTSLITSTAVSQLWRNLNNAPSWTLGRTLLSLNPQQVTSSELITSLGYGNYNALFATWKARDYHGLSAISNFTWGRALGTAATTQATSSATATDPFDIGANYGPNSFDIKFIYNMAVTYQVPFYKTQHGIVGHIVGGWTIAPLFTAQSGSPEAVSYTEGSFCTACQAFGESSSGSVTSAAEDAVFASPYTGGSSAEYHVTGTGGIATNNPVGVNQFTNPALVYSEFRPCILGYDTSCGGFGNLRTQPTWNVDATALKDIGVWKEGRVGATLSFQITNVLNHVQLGNPSLSLNSPTLFGRITTQANTPRNMEFGLRIHF